MSSFAEDLNWAEDAACRGQDTDAFYDHGDGQAREMARMFCRHCPVIGACFEEWLTLPYYAQRYGTWFNTTPQQRARMKRTVAGVRVK